MYEAVYEKDGEVLCRFGMRAKNERDVIAKAEEFFSEYPEEDCRIGQDGITVRVEPVAD
jgi:hypothetical protein